MKDMTGIVCTLGPSSWGLIKEMKAEGMSLARINGAFGVPNPKLIEILKEEKIPVLVDLPGNRQKKRDLTITDEELIKFAIKNKVDFVSISYVKNHEEVESLRKKLKGTNIKIVAKIEIEEGVKNKEKIIAAADNVLIDRGDLGTSVGFEKVPYHQKEIIKKCNELKKPVIVATEMMMSTINSSKPNCADVSDVFFAVNQGADFVMLSEETAASKDPLNSIKIMKKVIEEAKKYNERFT